MQFLKLRTKKILGYSQPSIGSRKDKQNVGLNLTKQKPSILGKINTRLVYKLVCPFLTQWWV